MQSPVDSFGEAVRVERARRRLTQRQLGELLHLSERTVMSVELARTNSRLETVAILAQGLDISLDAIVFPDKKREYLPQSVEDFFSGKSESEIQKYISLCQYVESMMAEEKGKK
ncbi:helix-turn-helix domain-containing protein [Acutalibacter caecimuris]|uniref:helix-turn-helix domain-containing protein n=1 Tax=Acutalibacter caecimuris TaxID=3093657 RepID=UPI002AC95E3E|nr:helix-turn-helix domain-containing protein [Acutalibacter sp. M00118]